MISFWEKQRLEQTADLIVIGAGIVGLHAALFYKRVNPNARVVVLERSNLSYGASTRNAGFACFGSPSELLAELQDVSDTELWDVVERRWKGLLRLRQEHGDAAINFENNGGYELFDEKKVENYEACLASLDSFNEVLMRITGEESVYVSADNELEKFQFGGVKHLIKNRLEGQINTGDLMELLWNKVVAAGVIVYNAVYVEGLERKVDTNTVYVSTTGWHGNASIQLKAEKVAVCTNAFASSLIGEIDIVPARAQVLITAPIPNLNWKGTFHYDEGYYYFRNVGERILFGGARNEAFAEEKTIDIGVTSKIQNTLDDFMRRVIRPQLDYSIEMRWSGIMGMGERNLLPLISQHSEGVFVAARCNGMGVAMGIQTAADLNDLLTSC